MMEMPFFRRSTPPSRTAVRSSRGLVRPTTMGSRERMTAPKKGRVTRLFFITNVTARWGRMMPGSMKVSSVLMWLATKTQGPRVAEMFSMPSMLTGQPTRSMSSVTRRLAWTQALSSHRPLAALRHSQNTGPASRLL